MGRPRGIKPSTVTLTISDGDTVTIKERLTAGEDMDLTSRSGHWNNLDGKPRIEIDTALLNANTVAIYLLGWSLVSAKTGNAIPWLSNTSLDEKVKLLRDELDGDTLREIADAIGEHRKQQRADLEGNATSGGSGGARPSPSAA